MNNKCLENNHLYKLRYTIDLYFIILSYLINYFLY